MARKRKRRLTPEAKRKRLLNDALKALQIGRAQFSDEQLRAEAEHHRFARESRADNQLAEGIGGRHFGSKHQLLWWELKRALNGCRKVSTRETLEEFAAIGRGRHPRERRDASQASPVEKLLHEALRRQHERHFDKFCEYLSWLCEGLLSHILFNPRPDYLNLNKNSLCCGCEICDRFRPTRNDLPKAQQAAICNDIRDLMLITNAVLTDSKLRAGLLTLYFLYPKAVCSTRDKIKWRPVFQALDDVCVHWRKRDRDDFTKPLDVLAWNFDDFKRLKGPERARAVFKCAGLDFDKWCIEHDRDEADVVRHLDRAMTDQLHLREKRRRSQ